MTIFKRGIVLFVFGLAVAVAGTAQAGDSIPLPRNDAFYTPPAGYESLSNGTVLQSRKINAEFLTPFLSTSVTSHFGTLIGSFAPYLKELKNLKINAYQVLYKSTDGEGRAVAEAATILVPQGSWAGHATMGADRPLVAFQSAEDSVSTHCEPSYTLRAGMLANKGGSGSISQFDVLLSFPALAEGYAVVYADYEGPRSEWLAGKNEAHGVLDGIRAALQYGPAGLAEGTKVALWGYSGGGGATGWAAEQAQVYAPGLNIVGAAIGASSNDDLGGVYTANNGTYTDGFLPMAIVALTRAFPDSSVTPYLTPDGKQLLARAGDSDACSIQNLAKFAFAGKLERYTTTPSQPLTRLPPARKLFRANSLLDQPLTPKMPVLKYHDVLDTIIPVKGGNELAKKYCEAGGRVEVLRTSTPAPVHLLVHGAGAIEGDLPALHYITNRFKGISPRDDCSRSWRWSLTFLPYRPYSTQ